MPCTLFSLLMLILFASISYYARSCGFEEKLKQVLTMNDKNILEHAGSISHKLALQKAANEYDKYKEVQKQLERLESIKELEKDIQKLNTNKRKKK